MLLTGWKACLQTGSSSFPGLRQASETQLPASPVYKDSCEHFSWPLLEPQVSKPLARVVPDSHHVPVSTMGKVVFVVICFLHHMAVLHSL